MGQSLLSNAVQIDSIPHRRLVWRVFVQKRSFEKIQQDLVSIRVVSVNELRHLPRLLPIAVFSSKARCLSCSREMFVGL
jgi:hypothetical protein